MPGRTVTAHQPQGKQSSDPELGLAVGRTAGLTGFEKMHTYANHLGLYSEEIGSTGEQIRTSRRRFSHLALISAAINLDYRARSRRRWPGLSYHGRAEGRMPP